VYHLWRTTALQSKAPSPLLTVHLPMEPSFVSLGPYHCAAGMNNRAWFYELGQNKATLLRDREYLGTVSSLRLSADYASVLYEGKLQLHMVSAPCLVSLSLLTLCDIFSNLLFPTSYLLGIVMFQTLFGTFSSLLKHSHTVYSVIY
jgi:hypothetical protein